MADLETLGDRLRRRRHALGIRSAELARRAKLSQSYVWVIEKARERRPAERRHPSRDVLIRWAVALGVEPDELKEWLALADYDPTLTRDEVILLSPDQDSRRVLVERAGGFALTERGEVREIDLGAIRVLQDRLEHLVVRAAVTDRQEEAQRLLTSYLDWLEFYLAR